MHSTFYPVFFSGISVTKGCPVLVYDNKMLMFRGNGENSPIMSQHFRHRSGHRQSGDRLLPAPQQPSSYHVFSCVPVGMK